MVGWTHGFEIEARPIFRTIITRQLPAYVHMPFQPSVHCPALWTVRHPLQQYLPIDVALCVRPVHAVRDAITELSRRSAHLFRAIFRRLRTLIVQPSRWRAPHHNAPRMCHFMLVRIASYPSSGTAANSEPARRDIGCACPERIHSR